MGNLSKRAPACTNQSSRMIAITALVAVAVLSAPVRPAAASGWHDDYRRGVKALQEGRLALARQHLERAVAAEPEPEAEARTYGMPRLGYLPHLQLAILSYRERDLEAAEAHLRRARSAGVAETTPEGLRLLRQHELLVQNLRFLRSGGPPERERSESDLRRESALARAVAEQCGEPPTRRAGDRPWYYHYRLAEKLSQHGDWLGALQQLSFALERRDEPGEAVRTYGMGFVAYRPWFELGRAHAHLGNWDCARDALELSAELEDFAERDRSARRERAELLKGARLRAASGG